MRYSSGKSLRSRSPFNLIYLSSSEARELGQKLLNLGVLKHAWSQTVFEDNSSLLSFVVSVYIQ